MADDETAAGIAVGEQAGEAAQPAGPEAEIQQLREQVIALEDRALRVQAEAQNMIRRAERDVENARKYALERFAGSLLPVLDNLERSLAAIGDPTDATRPVAEGIQLTLRHFLDVLQKFDVVAVDPAGQPFNPELHQAMAMVEQPEVAPNTVIQVMQKGYTLNGRLVRPAMVMVARPPARVDETV